MEMNRVSIYLHIKDKWASSAAKPRRTVGVQQLLGTKDTHTHLFVWFQLHLNEIIIVISSLAASTFTHVLAADLYVWIQSSELFDTDFATANTLQIPGETRVWTQPKTNVSERGVTVRRLMPVRWSCSYPCNGVWCNPSFLCWGLFRGSDSLEILWSARVKKKKKKAFQKSCWSVVAQCRPSQNPLWI